MRREELPRGLLVRDYFPGNRFGGLPRYGLHGCRRRSAASVREAGFMTASLQASVRRRAPQIQNPLANSDDTLIAGGKLYLNDCVGCHGEPGQPPSDFGATFYPPAPQFPSAGTQFSEAQIFWVAKNGIRLTGMYPQGASYSDSQLWSLAAFIRRARNLPPAVVKSIQPPPSK